jgi:hypothetical protein
VPKPSARPRIWLPKQMPNSGIRRRITSRASSTGWSAVAGSPGPGEKNTASAPSPSTSSTVDEAGSTCVVTPRAARRRGTLRLMPRSSAATVKRCSPSAFTVYGWRVVTSADRSAPTISGEASTRSRRAAGSLSTLDTPTRIAPRSRRCRVSARVSMPQMPTTPSMPSRSSNPAVARQFEPIRAGSRTT